MKLLQRKTLICLFAILTAIAIGLSFTAVRASAEEVSTSDYFKITGSGSTVYEDGNLVLKLEKDSTAEFKRELVLDDFVISLSINASVDFTVTYDSAIVTGNKVIDGEEVTYETEVTKTVSLSTTDTEVKISVDENYDLKINDVAYDDAKIFGGHAVGTIGFTAKDTDATVTIKYIDQKASDEEGAYKQTFAIESGATAPTAAKSIVLLSDSIYNCGNGVDIQKVKGQKLSVSFTEYSVMESSKSSSSFKAAKVNEDDAVYLWDSGKYVSVDSIDEKVTLNIVSGDEVCGSFTMMGVKEDTTAPNYKEVTEEVFESFKAALEEATYDEYDGESYDENGERYCIRIGSSKYLNIPSMENFVSDDSSTYSEMSYTVWYCNNDSSWTSYSGLKVPVASEGTYKFFVLFKDKKGNAMEKSIFLDDDGNIQEGMSQYVFEFSIVNNAPLSVSSTTQENAYKGISYTASSFSISAKDYEVEYTLYYSADGESGWEEITSASELEEGTDEYKKYSGYAYDGSLTFTPVKLGYYKIDATVYENGTFRTAESSVKIQATKTPVKVVPNESNWLYNNAWSIVFLSIGTLSLIGLIIVLCIKPKDEVK